VSDVDATIQAYREEVSRLLAENARLSGQVERVKAIADAVEAECEYQVMTAWEVAGELRFALSDTTGEATP